MSALFLIRHGQAGTREEYDRLSELGIEQAERLGDYFRTSGIAFDAVFSGTLRRQRETAQAVLARLPGAIPLVEEDPSWNEFDLEGLWTTFAPYLLKTDAEFAAAYDKAHRGRNDLDRTMTDADVLLIRRWVMRAESVDGLETWPAFCARVLSARQRLATLAPGARVAAFTSATPTALWCGSALGLDPRQTFRIAAVLFNASFSTIRLRGEAGAEEVQLFSLNNTPHLVEPRLRTFR